MDGEGTASPGVLEIRHAQGPVDWAIGHQMLDVEHLLGAGREAGDRLCQFVLEEGQPVAVLVWCAEAWHLKDRDERIGLGRRQTPRGGVRGPAEPPFLP